MTYFFFFTVSSLGKAILQIKHLVEQQIQPFHIPGFSLNFFRITLSRRKTTQNTMLCTILICLFQSRSANSNQPSQIKTRQKTIRGPVRLHPGTPPPAGACVQHVLISVNQNCIFVLKLLSDHLIGIFSHLPRVDRKYDIVQFFLFEKTRRVFEHIFYV